MESARSNGEMPIERRCRGGARHRPKRAVQSVSHLPSFFFRSALLARRKHRRPRLHDVHGRVQLGVSSVLNRHRFRWVPEPSSVQVGARTVIGSGGCDEPSSVQVGDPEPSSVQVGALYPSSVQVGARTVIGSGGCPNRHRFRWVPEPSSVQVGARTVTGSGGCLGLIRSRGHVPKGGYDVPNGSNHTSAVPPAIQ